MKIALFPNSTKPQAEEKAQEIARYLRNKGIALFAEAKEAEGLSCHPLTADNIKEIDLIIALGGDGTILRICHTMPEIDAPILAINLGGFGFLADIPAAEALSSIDQVLAGNYVIEEHIMMEGLSAQGERCYALNEFVIHRGQNHCLIDLDIYVDGIYLNTFGADGIIIATPTGSTAYSLSAGGPILTPHVQAYVLTPISAHTISNRPIVFMPKDKIEIRYISPGKEVEVTADGYKTFKMAFQDTYTIQPSTRTFKLILLPNHNFAMVLREKLGWARKLKM